METISRTGKSMIKFTLLIWVCSFLGQNQCMPPIAYPVLQNSWYECSQTAHSESRKILTKLGYNYVNKNLIGTKYSCRPNKSI